MLNALGRIRKKATCRSQRHEKMEDVYKYICIDIYLYSHSVELNSQATCFYAGVQKKEVDSCEWIGMKGWKDLRK